MTNQKQQKKENEETSIRPPVVVVLGHVDHGKSSLLEAIRNDLRITSKESGGITQHIGAYTVEYQGKQITFLDTPGHEAFSAMRSRGAEVADIGILVVAADEGVKPQTKEALKAAQDSKLSLIVALNKIDRQGSDPDRIKAELATEGVVAESMGGDTPFVETSATQNKGISELLDIILLVAEVAGLKADAQGSARGVVIEATKHGQKGLQVTLLIKEGTLVSGVVVGTPSAFGRVRLMEDFRGKAIEEAGPSIPVVVLGFEESPRVGEEFRIFATKEEAQNQLKAKEVKERKEPQEEGEEQRILLVLKADVSGSLEAVEYMLAAIPFEGIRISVLQAGVGDITEGDVKFAKSTGSRILGFRVSVSSSVIRMAEREKVSIETFDVIYTLQEHVRNLIEGSKEPEREEVGSLKILAIFSKEKGTRQIIGGKVTEGEAYRGTFDLVQQGQVVVQGRVINLQEGKKDAPRVSKGKEAGLMVECETEIQEGDTLVFFRKGQKKGE
ncbi:MAG: translation initiation factor IF-2 [bacterium]|nr:translation initiation factor IF-2 [bacterium]